jgi:hypothetical protein
MRSCCRIDFSACVGREKPANDDVRAPPAQHFSDKGIAQSSGGANASEAVKGYKPSIDMPHRFGRTVRVHATVNILDSKASKTASPAKSVCVRM